VNLTVPPTGEPRSARPTADLRGGLVLDAFSVPANLQSPRAARRRTADALMRHGCAPAVVDTAALLLSEVVTNAVVHAQSPAEIEVRADEPLLWVGVRDTASHRWPIRQPMNVGAASGRGLHLVAALATAWGALTHGDGGKTVWFSLPCHVE